MVFRATDQVLEGFALNEGARYERLHVYLAGVSVDLDLEAEGVVDLAAQVGVGVREGLGEVGYGATSNKPFSAWGEMY